MAFEQYIAQRYLLTRKELRFVNVISIISVIGVTIGVAALILVLSVYNGFADLVTTILMDFDPHLRIEATQKTDSVQYTSLLNYIKSKDNNALYAPFVSGKALIVARNVTRVVNIRAVDGSRLGNVSRVTNKVVLGSPDLLPNSYNIIIGMVLADRLGVVVGDTIAVLSPANAEIVTLQLGLPLIRKFKVTGIYESNNKDYDSYFAFIDLQSGQTLFGTKNTIDGYDIRFTNYRIAEEIKQHIQKNYAGLFRSLSWYDLHRELYLVMELERWGAYIVLCLIIAVASFNLLGSLTMTVIQKRRDIGILKAMGATDKSIRKIYLLQGVFVGVIGTTLGFALGYLLIYLQQHYHLFPLDPTVYIIPAIPVKAEVFDFITVGIASIGLCSLAAIIPAKRAAQLEPARAVRWE